MDGLKFLGPLDSTDLFCLASIYSDIAVHYVDWLNPHVRDALHCISACCQRDCMMLSRQPGHTNMDIPPYSQAVAD